MWNVQRIICIWICCVSCMFGTTQLSSMVAAVPYEYFDDHDQSFYDLDTEQIQAKYDTRLLSQHILKEPEIPIGEQHTLDSKKGSQRESTTISGYGATDVGMNEQLALDASFVLDNNGDNNNNSSSGNKNNNNGNMKRNQAAEEDGSSDILSKLKTNDASTNTNKAWMVDDETTPAITEKPGIHLPRAASCYTNGQKYTHGQKVPRHDICEVCLCMDGEIFCWWEKCDKKQAKLQTSPGEDYSTPYGETTSTMRNQENEKSSLGTTLRPMRKPKIKKDHKFHADKRHNGKELDNDMEALDDEDNDATAAAVGIPSNMDEDTEYDDINQRHEKWPYKDHNKQKMTQKTNNYDEHQHKEAFELKEKLAKVKKENLKKQQKQQPQQPMASDHHHPYHHPDHHASSGSSKILNFPENLPSVLYYDYKTEEHQHHQHQHREQHLKHQHEKELKHRLHPAIRHHEYGGDEADGDGDGQDFNTVMSVTMADGATPLSGSAGSTRDRSNMMVSGGVNDAIQQRHRQRQSPSSLLSSPSSSSVKKYLGNGNDNIFKVDLQTDSDILPEPPTKKPKLPSIVVGTGTMASVAGTPTTIWPYAVSTMSSTSAASITTRPLKKKMFTPWDYGKSNRDRINKRILQRRRQEEQEQQQKQQQQQLQQQDKGNVSTVAAANTTVVKLEDQDDAFHRWLTSTEKINKNLNGPQAGDTTFDGLGENFEEGDKNYENIDIDIDAMSVPVTAKSFKQQIAMVAEGGDSQQQQQQQQQLDNSGNLKYEINFTDNTGAAFASEYPATSSNDNDDNISPFSNPYENTRRNYKSPSTINPRNGIKSQLDKDAKNPTGLQSHSGITTSSNEDNGVGSVVNIDIMLTAASVDTGDRGDGGHQQQTQDPLKDQQIQPDQTNGKQNTLLISNSSGNGKNQASFPSLESPHNTNASDNPQQTLGVNFFSSNFNHNQSNNSSDISTNINNSHSFSDSFSLSQSLVSNSNATSFVASASSAQITPPTSTTLSPERQCNVMGTLYKIGDVLPQDTGNCLQCICIDGSTIDDTPRVTCSPHNCPPLVLPDLFDATGY
ncbi:uncharacterized protein LOC142240750 [Haematobia irritans]|uniref:uncharacterized protein LOC142240750 n=1 Tax=Haematobia irritans TaxID=7368 RepID=UPI003F502081